MKYKMYPLLFCVMLLFLSGCPRASYLEGSVRPVDPSIKPKIAIISDNRLAAALGTKLFTKGFTIIERLHLVSVLQEKSLQMSGLTDEQLLEAGKILNVGEIIFVDADLPNPRTVRTANIKIVSVQSGVITGSFNYQNGRGPASDDFNEAVNKIADAINKGYR